MYRNIPNKRDTHTDRQTADRPSKSS